MKVTTTTVVDDGKDGAPATKATWDRETISALVLKSDPERRYTLNVIYPADKADIDKALDGHRDFASKAAVEDAAWDYMRNYREVGTFHPEFTGKGVGEGAAEVVESYIYRGPDWAIKAADGSEVVIKAGDWLAGFVWAPQPWAGIQDGSIGGVSVFGKARRRKPSAEAVANLRG